MINYEILSEKSVSINVDKDVSNKEMEHMSLLIEALTDGNPTAKIYFQVQKGISLHRIKIIERLCESIPNHYTIEQLEKDSIVA